MTIFYNSQAGYQNEVIEHDPLLIVGDVCEIHPLIKLEERNLDYEHPYEMFVCCPQCSHTSKDLVCVDCSHIQNDHLVEWGCSTQKEGHPPNGIGHSCDCNVWPQDEEKFKPKMEASKK